MALYVWAWIVLLAQLQWGCGFVFLPMICCVFLSLPPCLWAEGPGAQLGDLAAFFVFLQGVWHLWLLSVYMCLCLQAMFIGVSGFGS